MPAVLCREDACRHVSLFIRHNYFRDFAHGGGANGWETIQFAQGALSTATWSANTVASNLFFQCDGEGEIVSVKNSGNTFLGNVFRKCRGKLVIRMGHDCRMEGNYFFGDGGVSTGGIRIITLVADDSLNIVNTGASGVTANSADLVGLLNCPNGEFTVIVYWSTNDHADAFAWLADGDAQSMEIGTYSNVDGQAVTGSVSSLTPNATYYYTMAATNGATNIWASPNVSFTPTAPTALVIYVKESATNSVDFWWNGVIGASGPGTASTLNPSADQIVPNSGNLQAGDRTTNDQGHKWKASEYYAGTVSLYGSGAAFSEFLTTQNIPFFVKGSDGTLHVGYTDQANTNGVPDLSSQTFTGSFSLTNNLAHYGLFTTGYELPLTLWTADSGDGAIVFAAGTPPGPAATLFILR